MRELIYGRNAVYECLRAGQREVYKLLVSEGAQEKGALSKSLRLAGEKSIAIQRVPRAQLDRISDGHQGVAAEVNGYPYVALDDLTQWGYSGRGEGARADRSEALGCEADQGEGLEPLFLVLDCVQDPQNLGALLRTAEAVGVSGVVIAQDRAASITPAVVNASSGATEHLRIARVTNIVRSLEKVKKADVWVVGLEDRPDAQDYVTADLRGPLALVVGSEGEGIRRLVRETCDFVIKLPMLGKITSLNAAVAGSIVLYETLRQRRASVS
jgi:23S rRNA (guanosine2251-2'-O)-methyltransferase